MTDILLDNNFDLQIIDNDLTAGTSDEQHMALLLMVSKGGFKESPVATVGATNYLESENNADFLREVRLRFSQDGCNITGLGFDNTGKLNVTGAYAN